MMEGHHHHHHHHHQHQQQQQYSGLHSSIDTGGVGGSVAAGGGDRFPQWSIQETKDFLMIRAELDPTFMETKRNKLLWEVIAKRMREKGYNRSPEQCKCKWKNLVTRYKGCETMEPEGMRQQFPYYNELQAIFAARMQRMLWMESHEGGGGASGSKKKGPLSSDEEDENMEDSEGEKGMMLSRKKRKTKGSNPISGSGGASSSSNYNNETFINNVREMLDEFMKQQLQMEMQWLQAHEAREEERMKREMEWRQTMEALENERLMMERRWREREEQRRIREETRAEERDALITALLNKLRREDL